MSAAPPLRGIPQSDRRATDAASRNLTLALLLESGDRAELAWLFRELGREAVADFVRRCGGRKLSARSRRFWSRALGVEEPLPHPLAGDLWPLA